MTAGRDAPNPPTVVLTPLRKPLCDAGPVFRGAKLGLGGITIYNFKKAPSSLLNPGTSVTQLAQIIGVP